MKVKLKHLKKIREASGKTQEEVASDLEYVLGSYRNWEQLRSSPSEKDVHRLSDYFGCSVEDLTGLVPKFIPGDLAASVDSILGTHRKDTSKVFPLVGWISAGSPLDVEEVVEEMPVYDSLVEECKDPIGIRVVGDSMNNIVPDGYIAVIDKGAEVHNGDIAAVKINGDEATLKRYSRSGTETTLSPDSTNPEHKSIIIDEDSPDAKEFRIVGKFMGARWNG